MAYAFAPNLVNPYVQNYNISIQRSISQTTSITLGFVYSAGVKLLHAYDLNQVDVTNNGFLPALFNTVQSGGDSPLMDAIVKPLGLTSATMRTSSLYEPYFYANNPASLLALFNGTSLTGGVNGGSLFAAAGLPVNFAVVNPQFATYPLGNSANNFGGAYYNDNSGHSTYNSLQISVNHRLSHGLTVQSSYVWSKALGDSDTGDGTLYFGDYRTLTNQQLNKELLFYNHAGVFKINGVYNVPLGPGGMILKGNSVVDKLVGGWQLAGIFTYYTGAPLTITGAGWAHNQRFNGNPGRQAALGIGRRGW